MTDLFSFLFHSLAVPALLIQFLLHHYYKEMYTQYHKKAEDVMASTVEAEKDAYIIYWIVFASYFIWLVLGLFTFHWFLFVPLIATCFYPKKWVSANLLRGTVYFSIITLSLICLNYSHFRIGDKPETVKIEEKAPEPKKAEVSKLKKGKLMWAYGKGFYQDTSNGLKNFKGRL